MSARVLCAWIFFLASVQAATTGLPIVFESHGGGGIVARSPQYRFTAGAGPAATFRFANDSVTVGPEAHGAGSCRAAQPLGSVTRLYGPAAREWAHYGSVLCPDVHPGIDWIWRSGKEITFELRAAPFSNLERVRLRFRGIRELRVEPDGALLAIAGRSRLRFERPRAFQGEGWEQELAVRYRVHGATVRFEVYGWDRSRRLLIDPVVTGLSFLGGARNDIAYGAAVDTAGNIYVTGGTESPDFPHPGAPGGATALRDAFVSKLSPDGSTLIYTTILSSAGNDEGLAIAVDPAGAAYVSGVTSGTGFPVTQGALRATLGGQSDAFIARLDSEGRLSYASYLGDSGMDAATAVAVNGGNIYVAGYTNSGAFPVSASAPQRQFQGGYYDAFLAKVNPGTGTLVYSTFLGGNGNDVAKGVAVSAAGEACMVGRTESDGLPVIAAPQRTRTGNGDAFLACLNAAGTAWTQVSYFGGTSEDEATAIAIDAGGNRHIAGSTYSPDFPGAAGPAADYDAFLSIVSPAGALLSSRLIGGGGADGASAVATNGTEDWLAGSTRSPSLPGTAGGSGYAGNFDAFVCQVGTAVSCSYLGGLEDDRAYAIALRGADVVVAGVTGSAAFTTPAGVPGGNAPPPQNAFIAIMAPSGPPFSETVEPASGSGYHQTFTVSVVASGGVGTIGEAMLLVDTSTAGVSACGVSYLRAENRFVLADDGGAGTAPGADNRQCTLETLSSGAVTDGSVLRVTFSIRFKAAFAGTKNLYVRTIGTESSTDWRLAGTYTVEAVDQPPAATEVLLRTAGSTQVFDIAIADPDGAGDALWALLLLNSTLSGVNACYAVYNRASNLVYLVDNSGALWLAPVTAGGAGTVSNGQCTLDGASSGAQISGGVLRVSFGLRFASGFAGTKRMNVLAWDTSLESAGWNDMGSYTVR